MRIGVRSVGHHWRPNLRIRKCVCLIEPKCILGRRDCKRRHARAIRGCVQIARRLLVLHDAEVAQMICARHEAPAPRLPVRCGGRTSPEYWWPGMSAEVRVPSGVMVAEPRTDRDDAAMPQSASKHAASSGIHAAGLNVPASSTPKVFKDWF